MNEQTIGFIGGGNMATSLIGGLIAGEVNEKLIWVADPDLEKQSQLKEKFNINVSDDNQTVVKNAKVLILAVKPQILRSVIMGISKSIRNFAPLILSIAAGIRESDLEHWCGGLVPLVRCMPNTPALVGTGATALHANAEVSDQQRDTAESIMRSVGLTVWVKDEEMLDAVTAVSGSGPAYFFLLMETMEQAALDLGLDQETARLLIQQTALGAAKVALEVEESPADLRRKVTSPGGTTECAINVFVEGGLSPLVTKALKAAKIRSIELSKELGGD